MRSGVCPKGEEQRDLRVAIGASTTIESNTSRGMVKQIPEPRETRTPI